MLYYALTSTRFLSRPCIQQQDFQLFHLFRDILYRVRLEPILSLLSTILSPPFVLALSWLRMSSFRVSFCSTRDDIRIFVIGRIGLAVPLPCSFRFSWISLLSANKSSLSVTLVSILFLHQWPHRQVLSISLQSTITVIIIVVLVVSFFKRCFDTTIAKCLTLDLRQIKTYVPLFIDVWF